MSRTNDVTVVNEESVTTAKSGPPKLTSLTKTPTEAEQLNSGQFKIGDRSTGLVINRKNLLIENDFSYIDDDETAVPAVIDNDSPKSIQQPRIEEDGCISEASLQQPPSTSGNRSTDPNKRESLKQQTTASLRLAANDDGDHKTIKKKKPNTVDVKLTINKIIINNIKEAVQLVPSSPVISAPKIVLSAELTGGELQTTSTARQKAGTLEEGGCFENNFCKRPQQRACDQVGGSGTCRCTTEVIASDLEELHKIHQHSKLSVESVAVDHTPTLSGGDPHKLTDRSTESDGRASCLNESVETVDNAKTQQHCDRRRISNECGLKIEKMKTKLLGRHVVVGQAEDHKYNKRYGKMAISANENDKPKEQQQTSYVTDNVRQARQKQQHQSQHKQNIEKGNNINAAATMKAPPPSSVALLATRPIGSASQTLPRAMAGSSSNMCDQMVAGAIRPTQVSTNGAMFESTLNSKRLDGITSNRNNHNNGNISSSSSINTGNIEDNNKIECTRPVDGSASAAYVRTVANMPIASTTIVTGDLDHDKKLAPFKLCSSFDDIDDKKIFASDESRQKRQEFSLKSDAKFSGCLKGKFCDNTEGKLFSLQNGTSSESSAKADNVQCNAQKLAESVFEADLSPLKPVEEYISDDPYSELESYLEKVKREINEVFEQYGFEVLPSSNDELPRSAITDNVSLSSTTTTICINDNKRPEQKMLCSVNYPADNGSNEDQRLNKIRKGSQETIQPNTTTKEATSMTGPETRIRNDLTNIGDLEQQQQMDGGQRARWLDAGDEEHKHRTYEHHQRTSHHAVAAPPAIATKSRRKSHESNDVNLWANTVLRELDNLMQSDKRCSTKTVKDHVGMVASTVNSQQANNSANSCEKNRSSRGNILRPEKHTTIPLHSFNLENPNLDSTTVLNSKKPPIDVARKLSAPGALSLSHKIPNTSILMESPELPAINVDETETITTVLKIEEDVECDRTVNLKHESPPNSNHKKASSPTTGLILGDSGGKKGSTSTIWTSEESILRSGGAVDEDNKSTSSSACDEATGNLSSGKSGNSLDSSELDNDNHESGIGTATPPKDSDSWSTASNNRVIAPRLQHIRNQNSIGGNGNLNSTSSHPFNRLKYYKSNCVASSDDPDLLEVLSQCDGNNNRNNGDDEDVLRSRDYDGSFDYVVDSSGGGVSLKSMENVDEDGVVLRHKPQHHHFEVVDSYNSQRHGVSLGPYRSMKGRSHSIETALSPHNDVEPFVKAKDDDAFRAKRSLCLPLNQELFQSNASSNIRELPSPSSASLHSGHGNLTMQELTTKSNSAPILLKKEKRREDFCSQPNTLRYSRSQSDRYLAEIEASEACKWLRAAGFPQYAQMYEDLQFPIDLSNVARDHPILEADPLQSLYRRLCTLNRCATMRLDSAHKHQHIQQKEDSDDEGCALSENWTFERHNRRWSRIGENGLELPTLKKLEDKAESSSKDSSPDRFDDENVLSLNSQNDCDDHQSVRFRRTGSERIKDGAKALLRRVESIKSRRRKRQNREGLVISGPQVLDLAQLNRKASDLKSANVTAISTPPSPVTASPVCSRHSFMLGHDLKLSHEGERFLSPNRLSPKHTPSTPRSVRTSPLHFFSTQMPHLKEGKSDDSSSYYSDSQESSGGGRLVVIRRHPSKSRRFLQRSGKVDDIGALSDSECHQSIGRKIVIKDPANTTEKVKKLTRGGSLNLGKDSKRYREAFQSRSFRSKSAVRRVQKNCESDQEEPKTSHKIPVVRWHSFQNNDRPQLVFKKCFSGKVEVHQRGTMFSSMSCGQLQVIRKLALVTLTGYMERYCPSHRTGWNWELPKFIKKIKTPDYKDKKVFGVPILLGLQRTGHSLPKSIRSAITWLETNAMDQTGIFRKSGVKSRIAKLKETVESRDSNFADIYDTHQAYDVADMLKQYFRDLPECLLTTKLSETFVAIFQHLPADVRFDAVQSAVLLLPDEHREVLHAILEFLYHVTQNSHFNQMNAHNLAVCLAPSLFNNSVVTGRASSVSPRRKKPIGVPDAKELSETKASHECLAFLIAHYREVFTASRDKLVRCNFGYMEESKPVPLEALGEGMQFHNWRGYLYECTSATIKEGREKSRGWVTTSSLDPAVEIAYKKVGDGHPLRLWRCFIEVEGPPIEVLDYILKERRHWDSNFLKSRTVQILDGRNEIFQYACDGQTITDYCVLRSWQPDLPRGACVVVETSVEHSAAKLLLGGVRGVVLASRYLIEPSGSGRSRIMHLARVDTKGRTPDWYNKCYGHICSHYLLKIRAAFRHVVTDGPESKV